MSTFSFCSTEKEKRILHYLFKQKIATFSQIHRFVFPEVSRSMVSKRLTRLLRAKLILKSIVGFQNKWVQVFHLSDGAAEALFDEEAHPYTRYQVQSNAVEHDILLGEVRNRLIRSPLVKRYWMENELQCLPESAKDPALAPYVFLRSDAVMELKIEGKIYFVPVELEVSQKAQERYEQKLGSYYKREDLLCVPFISANTEVQTAVMKTEKEIYGERQPLFYYAQLNDLLHSKEQMEFKNIQGRKFVLPIV